MSDIDKNHLTDEEYEVTQNCGTEAPFSGKYLNEKSDGTYHCKVCDSGLFNSNTKYDSGTGWPSFFDEIPDSIYTKEDNSHGMIRTEILCKKCGSHLGHLFEDGPQPTGYRYCVNSLSLNFHNG